MPEMYFFNSVPFAIDDGASWLGEDCPRSDHGTINCFERFREAGGEELGRIECIVPAGSGGGFVCISSDPSVSDGDPGYFGTCGKRRGISGDADADMRAGRG